MLSSYPAPHLMRGLSTLRRGGCNGLFRLHPRCPSSWCNLHWSNIRPPEKTCRASLRSRGRAHQEIRHLHARLFRGARLFAGIFASRAQTQALETRMEGRSDRIRKPAMAGCERGYSFLKLTPCPALDAGPLPNLTGPASSAGQGEMA